MKILPFYVSGLPADVQPLVQQLIFLATDLRWTWSHAGDALWKNVDPLTWEQRENPYAVLQNLTRERLQDLAEDKKFIDRLQRLVAANKDYCGCAGWFNETYTGQDVKNIAYFSMEYGLGEALPLYAGGLGILAGDYLKAASDLGVPLVAVGLLYQGGYFRQMLDATGWQQEIFPFNDSSSLPISRVQARSGAWLHVSVDFPGRSVKFRVWQARVGRVTLYLLDSNDPLNSAIDRGITGKLYDKGQEQRLIQEIALGIGGWRVLEALRIQISVCHLNEGHAAFVTLERAHCFMKKNQCDFWDALWATRIGNIFTTHTPVDAGFDRFEPTLLLKYGQDFADKLGIEIREIVALGRKDPSDDTEWFSMANLAIRSCGRVNGVSRLHGEVSRRIFQHLFQGWPQHQVPVTHITNGVHVPSWDSPWADDIWTKTCGQSRWLGTLDRLPLAIEQLSDEALWTFDGQERADLIDHVRKRLVRQFSQGGAEPATVAQAANVLDPNILTLGFARRFTDYKRPNLLLHDPARLARLLTNADRPVQIIVAGKAHQEDEAGKRYIQEWFNFVARDEVRAHAVFLQDYDITLAQELVQGVDVWINTPRRPGEACGTSGMKVLVNGGLNLSELDGWWAEAYTPEVGWALGDGREHSEPGWDAIEAGQLYRLLEEEIVPGFYQRDVTGIPRAWVARMRASMADLTPRFSANRMMRDYVETMYLPASAAFQRRSTEEAALAKALRNWQAQLYQHWHEVHLGNLSVSKMTEGWSFELHVYLAEISPEDVQVQLYADATHSEESECEVMERSGRIAGTLNGYLYRYDIKTQRFFTDFTPRVVAYHPEARIPLENNLILWWVGEVALREVIEQCRL